MQGIPFQSIQIRSTHYESDTNLNYQDFIPSTDTEDDERQDVHFSSAPPKTPKRTHEQRARRRSRKTVDSDMAEYISEEERDLSMYRLSDEDSDSNLIIYYKAYSNNKPEINESSSESVERTQRMEVEIARMMKEARKQKQDKKKRQRTAKSQRPRTKDTTPDTKGYHTDSDDDPAINLRLTPPAACRRKDLQWTANFGHYRLKTLLNCPQHILLDTQHLLYENPLPPFTTQTIEVLYDTGRRLYLNVTCAIFICMDEYPPVPPLHQRLLQKRRGTRQ
jgi:hypothetical protein